MNPTNNQQQNPFYDYCPFNAQAESLVGKFGKGKFDFEETDMFVNGRTVTVDLTSIYNKCICLHLSKLAVAHCNARNQGFDVKETPPTFLYGQIKPLKLISKVQKDECEELAKFAIAAFNNNFKEFEGELQFDELVRAMGEPISGMKYYLTFIA